MSDAVQQIKDRLNIVDIISPYVELHKAGKNFKGKSPFSAEKTPSFYVSPDRGMYYCFSTSQGGDMFNFVQAMEGVDFKGALKLLAERAGVELVPEDPRKKSERERMYSATEAATVFYQERLEKEAGAIEYLENRGVLEETISTWRIGYAPGPPDHGWRELKDVLSAKDFTNEELLKAGLIKTADSGKEPFDVFRDRVMFPMSDPGGRVVAFSGRILHANDKSPKYVNSPETQLYKKSELLFGYDKAKQGIRTFDFSLIVEGQFDVVMCHQAGYTNTVAVSGTALTEQHVQLLERLSDRVVLALDADRAGIVAMKKAADLMLRRGIDVKVAEMPAGKDPADIIKEDKDSFKKIIGKSVHVIEFLLHVLKQQHADERSLKLKAREEILPFVLLMPNRIDQDHFVGVIADAIGAGTDAIRFELDRLREDYQVAPSGGDGGASDKILTTNLLERTQLYLAAASEVRSEVADLIQKELSDMAALVSLAELDNAILAKTTFELSDSYNHKKDREVYTDIAIHLNVFRREVSKTKLAELRNHINDGDISDEILEMIKTCEGMRKEEKYSDTSLLGEKD